MSAIERCAFYAHPPTRIVWLCLQLISSYQQRNTFRPLLQLSFCPWQTRIAIHISLVFLGQEPYQSSALIGSVLRTVKTDSDTEHL